MIQSFDARFGEEWQKMLSPGEQQRLMFTRILYWKPRFAGKKKKKLFSFYGMKEGDLYKLNAPI